MPVGRQAGPAPLLLQLHGRGGGGPWFNRMAGFVELSERAGFVVAIPEAIGGIWNDGRDPDARVHGRPDDVAYLRGVIDDVQARLSIDARRIYVVGMSNGATMAGRLACESAGLIAAFGQVAGTAAVGVASTCRPGVPVPLIQIHGSADRYAPYGGGQRQGILATTLLLGRGLGPVAGVDDWARAWVEANHADEHPATTRLEPDVTVRRWRGPQPACDIDFYRIDGGGHTWPGSPQTLPRFLFGSTSQTISATQVIWDFLAAHSR